MLNEPTVENLHELRLAIMAEAWQQQQNDAKIARTLLRIALWQRIPTRIPLTFELTLARTVHPMRSIRTNRSRHFVKYSHMVDVFGAAQVSRE